MPKLREAALVAAMVGSVSMLGAGAASAHGGEEPPPAPVTVNCHQDAGDNTATPQVGLINLNGPLLSGGAADSSATQQVCGIDNDNAENNAGDATGGAGGTLGLEL